MRFAYLTVFTSSWARSIGALTLAASALAPTQGAAQVSRNVTLRSHLDSYATYSACWSYVHHDGREYAILGTTEGTSIVRLTDPANPVEVGFINGPTSDWREAKQYRNWVYVVTEGTGAGRGLQVISMENPDQPDLVKTYRQPLLHSRPSRPRHARVRIRDQPETAPHPEPHESGGAARIDAASGVY